MTPSFPDEACKINISNKKPSSSRTGQKSADSSPGGAPGVLGNFRKGGLSKSYFRYAQTGIKVVFEV